MAQGKPLSVLKCERVKDVLCSSAPDRVSVPAGSGESRHGDTSCWSLSLQLICSPTPPIFQVLRYIFAQAEKQMLVDGSLPVEPCVDMLMYLELFHLCEVIADTVQDTLDGIPEQQRLLRKRDRFNALALAAAMAPRRK